MSDVRANVLEQTASDGWAGGGEGLAEPLTVVGEQEEDLEPL